MTVNDYEMAWGIYAVSALGCMLAWFYFTGWMWRYAREPLRVLVAIILFTPTIVDPARDFYAPAIAITAMDVLFKDGSDLWRSVADLVMYGAFVFAVYAVFVVVRVLLQRKKNQTQAAQRHTSADKNHDYELSEPTLQQVLAADADSPESGLREQR